MLEQGEHSQFSAPLRINGPAKSRKEQILPWAAAIAVNSILLALIWKTAHLSWQNGNRVPKNSVPFIIIADSLSQPVPDTPPVSPVQEPALQPPAPVASNDLIIDVSRPEAPPKETIPDPVASAADLNFDLQEELLDETLDGDQRPPEQVRPALKPLMPQRPPPQLTPPQLTPPQPPPIDYSGLTGPEIDALYKQQQQRLAVDVPERGGAGGPSGVIAIYCLKEFVDAEKAAECAGRPEIRSGWVKGAQDWSDITAALRRGGGPTQPEIGAPYRRPLADNERYYQSEDGRYIIGASAAHRLERERKAAWLGDETRGVMAVMDSSSQSMSNLSGAEVTNYITNQWEPSWTLREDPDIDLADIERLQYLNKTGDDSE